MSLRSDLLRETAVSTINAAIDAGVDLIDTARACTTADEERPTVCCVQGGEDPLDVDEELRSGPGRFDVPGGAVEQANAEIALRLRGRPAQRRLRDQQLLDGPGHDRCRATDGNTRRGRSSASIFMAYLSAPMPAVRGRFHRI
ncbi:hypothetical protein ABZ178_39855 [Streptomyces massasporeus]|uniref:hypothetical protein n=1 Tax=Streptomyces massasporeus TaxID=67324 RepID=UPI0016737F90|nr:hypothetical protein [Streptomyces massasporeus]